MKKKKLPHPSRFFDFYFFLLFEKTMKSSSETKRQKTTHEPKLYSDCLQKILSFGKPMEIWDHRLISSDWHKAVPVALLQVHSAYVTDDNGVAIHEIIANLCPNLTSVFDTSEKMDQVKYFWCTERNSLILQRVFFFSN